MNRDEELKAIGTVVDRLAERFPEAPRSSIEAAVREEHESLNEGRIRDFVPILVEHAAKARLSG
ncbi:three-helix bundle dimerization domain-containing protein [Arthrobacter sp. 2YAF22_2]|uniref:three-helix bundle dimerization domain-containing protein n=1 Tax=Arthrobacter sp. 2YAF22_2 TaxID=3233029 RepID=UPI003F8F3754